MVKATLFVAPQKAHEHCSRAPPAIGALLNFRRQDSGVRMCVLIRHLEMHWAVRAIARPGR